MINRWISGLLMILVIIGGTGVMAAGSLRNDAARAFRSGNPGMLAGRLPAGKVFMSIPAAGVQPGNYSRKQAMSALRQMFKAHRTESVTVSGGSGDSVRVVWSFRGRKGVRTITVYIQGTKGKISSIRGE